MYMIIRWKSTKYLLPERGTKGRWIQIEQQLDLQELIQQVASQPVSSVADAWGGEDELIKISSLVSSVSRVRSTCEHEMFLGGED